MFSMQKKDNKWIVYIKKDGEQYPAVVHRNQSFAKAKMLKMQNQIKSHNNPKKVEEYFFGKAKALFNS